MLLLVNYKVFPFQVIDEARIVKDICKNKQVKCIKEAQGKVYIGCMDSSIQVGLNFEGSVQNENPCIKIM